MYITKPISENALIRRALIADTVDEVSWGFTMAMSRRFQSLPKKSTLQT
jgi:hypothetical protein